MAITKKTIARFIVEFYGAQAAKYGGARTLNELRVIAQCYEAYTYDRAVSITEIADTLEMPKSTVHRAVTKLIEEGWITDRADPSDGRRRIIELSEKGVSRGLWQAAAGWLEQFSSPD